MPTKEEFVKFVESAIARQKILKEYILYGLNIHEFYELIKNKNLVILQDDYQKITNMYKIVCKQYDELPKGDHNEKYQEIISKEKFVIWSKLTAISFMIKLKSMFHNTDVQIEKINRELELLERKKDKKNNKNIGDLNHQIRILVNEKIKLARYRDENFNNNYNRFILSVDSGLHKLNAEYTKYSNLIQNITNTIIEMHNRSILNTMTSGIERTLGMYDNILLLEHKN